MRVRETVPDAVLGARRRGRAHRPHARRRCSSGCGRARSTRRSASTAALNNFFKIENLAALREIALRQVAEEVEAKRIVAELVGTREDRVLDAAPQAVGRAAARARRPQPGAQRVVRRAWRSAQRLGAPLDVLWVQPPGRDRRARRSAQLAALRALARVLGAHLIVEEADDVAAATARVAEGARNDLRPDGRARAAQRPGAVCETRAAPPPAARSCRASTCGSWPTARRARRDRDDARGDRRRRHRGRARWSVGCGGRCSGASGAARSAPGQPAHPASRSRGSDLSRDALDAALRLANAEHATLVPAYLAACRSTCRSTRPSRASARRRSRCWRRSSSARPERTSRWTAASRAGARPATPLRGCSTRRATTGSSRSRQRRLRRLRLRRHTLAHRQRRGRARGPAPLQVRAAALWERNAGRARLSGTELESGRIKIS